MSRLKHVQDTVFAAVWSGEVESIVEAPSEWLQDTRGNAVTASVVARQIAHGHRNDGFAGAPPLAVARALLALTGGSSGDGCIGLFDITAAFVHSPIDELSRNCQEFLVTS